MVLTQPLWFLTRSAVRLIEEHEWGVMLHQELAPPLTSHDQSFRVAALSMKRNAQSTEFEPIPLEIQCVNC